MLFVLGVWLQCDTVSLWKKGKASVGARFLGLLLAGKGRDFGSRCMHIVIGLFWEREMHVYG